jgi:CheY-like chemotaxis protein
VLPYAAGESHAGLGGAAPARATLKARTAPASRWHLLLVEDEPGVRNAMRLLLQMEGYQVTAAASAEEALSELEEVRAFDLIVTDFHLEDNRTGTEVISRAREILGPAQPAILVSGDTSSAVREIQCDANLKLTSKPINSEELLGLVKSLLPH